MSSFAAKACIVLCSMWYVAWESGRMWWCPNLIILQQQQVSKGQDCHDSHLYPKQSSSPKIIPEDDDDDGFVYYNDSPLGSILCWDNHEWMEEEDFLFAFQELMLLLFLLRNLGWKSSLFAHTLALKSPQTNLDGPANPKKSPQQEDLSQ